MPSELFSDVAGDVGDPTRPLVVLCHGAMDRSAGMLRLSRRLDDRCAVIRYDRRGYARSGAAGGPYTVAQHVADLEDVLDTHAPGRRVALGFGHSFGGNVVLALAARRPDRFERVAVYETPMSWLDWWPQDGASGMARRSSDPHDAAEAFMRRMVGDERWEALPQATRDGRRAEGPAMLAELADLGSAAPWRADQVSVPVLTMCGEHARPQHRRAMRELADALPHAEHRVLDGAGHAAPNTHPGELAARLLEFGLSGDG